MVPGSTLIYGSSFCTATLRPRSLRSNPVAAAVTPFPTEETTPPVKNIYFVVISYLAIKIRAERSDRRERSRSGFCNCASTALHSAHIVPIFSRGHEQRIQRRWGGRLALPIGETFLCRVEKFLSLHPTNFTRSSAARRISRKIKPNFAS